MSKRETGYYWCQVDPTDIWRPFNWNGKQWNVSGWYKEDSFMFAIHETRIPEPTDNNNQH